jgi:hypothetical protein
MMDNGLPFDGRFFDTLREHHGSAQREAQAAEQASLQWSRGTDEAESLLGRAEVARQVADRIAGQLGSETARVRTHCQIWKLPMPTCDQNGWVTADADAEEGRAR